MSYYGKILFLSLLAVFSACGSKTDEHAGKPGMPEKAVLATTQGQRQDSLIEDNETCVRGQAEPVIRKKYFPNTNFVLQPDSLTAIETVSFANGDKLIIRNWGCEYYALTFRFETSKFKASTSDLNYWYAAASKLMNQAAIGVDAPIDIKQGIKALEKYAVKNSKHLALQTEIDFGGDEIRNFVTLDTIRAMQPNRFAVITSFVIGPL